MGAIYGIVGDASSADLRSMGRRLTHRGHTTEETRISAQCWFGTRSEAPETGVFQCDHLAVVCDATLFNLDQIRAEIEDSGYVLNSETTPETILAAYHLWGARCFERFHGDFAICIWDDARQVLTMAIDPMDTRPLYLWQGGDRLVFASEYKAILALDEVPATPDLQAIQHLQYTKFPPPNRTLLQGIRTISPGYWVEFSEAGKRRQQYWRPSIDLRPYSEAEFARQVRAALEVAVRRRITDVNTVGINLSGGIDSTSLLGVLRHVAPDMPIHTFTAGFGHEDPEMQVAGLAAVHCGAMHHPVVVPPHRVPELLPRIVWHLEDPIARSEVVFNHELAATAARHVDTVFIGYGADDTFIGMPKYKILRLMEQLPALRRPLAEFYDYTQSSATPQSGLGRALKSAYFRGTEPEPPHVIGSNWQPEPSTFPAGGAEFINRYLVDGFASGHRDMAKNERLHTAHRLTIRYPLQDLDLVSLAFQIPDRLKLHRWREKHILREAVRPFLPDAVVTNPKFPSQMRSDLEFSDMLAGYAREILNPIDVASRNFFSPLDINQLLRRSSGRPYHYRHAMRIWTLVMTELWARAFIDRRGKPASADDSAEIRANERVLHSMMR